eukprot:scaffold460_cov81-Skeletonema_menzelii.AAC.13
MSMCKLLILIERVTLTHSNTISSDSNPNDPPTATVGSSKFARDFCRVAESQSFMPTHFLSLQPPNPKLPPQL